MEMSAFDRMIEIIKKEEWLVTNNGEGCLRTKSGMNCPLQVLFAATSIPRDYSKGLSQNYVDFGGDEREAWLIMSAADNYQFLHTNPIRKDEVAEMRARLLKALDVKYL